MDLSKMTLAELVLMYCWSGSNNSPSIAAVRAERRFNIVIPEAELQLTCAELFSAITAEITRRVRAGGTK